MLRVIVINGSGGVGKDSFVDACRKYTAVLNLSTVEPVKEALKSLGYKGAKTEEDRQFLSDVWDAWYRYNKGPVRYITKEVKSFDYFKGLIFVHMRQIKAIPELVEAVHAVTLLVTNSRVAVPGNHADSEVDQIYYDHYIDNEGTLEDLDLMAKEFVEKIWEV